jgi:hypothetical protein
MSVGAFVCPNRNCGHRFDEHYPIPSKDWLLVCRICECENGVSKLEAVENGRAAPPTKENMP